MSITLVAARLGAILGNLVFGLLLDVTCAVPILLVAALLMGTNTLKLFLKKSQQSEDCYLFRWWHIGNPATQHN